jgi:hypothetical protein
MQINNASGKHIVLYKKHKSESSFHFTKILFLDMNNPYSYKNIPIRYIRNLHMEIIIDVGYF